MVEYLFDFLQFGLALQVPFALARNATHADEQIEVVSVCEVVHKRAYSGRKSGVKKLEVGNYLALLNIHPTSEGN